MYNRPTIPPSFISHAPIEAGIPYARVPDDPSPIRRKCMSEHVYKLVELVGSSTIGIEDAVQNAITKAAATIRNMRWFQVVETRGYIDAGKIAYWQVTVKIGFTIEP
jgi:dodecin